MSVRVLHGDCRDVLPTLSGASVQCCVTSPPYYGLRDYGVAGQMGLEATPEDYIAAMVAVFRQVRRVLREDGTLWLNVGDSYATQPVPGLKPKDLLMMPARLALALQADGWYVRSDIIWHKPNPMPESVTDRPTSAHEHVFLLTRSPRYFYDAEAVREEASENTHSGYASSGTKTLANADAFGVRPSAFDGYRPPYRNSRNVWTIATAPFPEAHFATFPPELAERCIKAGTSERGCCAQCGTPWVREVERTFIPQRDTIGGLIRRADGLDASSGWKETPRGTTEGTTTGWSPSCQCNAPTQPCTVLDPFGGAGTTGLVADRLQRSAILIELSESYAAMARNRIVGDAPLLAEVAD